MNHEQPCLGALAVRLGSVDAVVIRGPEAEEDAELVIIIIIIMIIMIIIIIPGPRSPPPPPCWARRSPQYSKCLGRTDNDYI